MFAHAGDRSRFHTSIGKSPISNLSIYSRFSMLNLLTSSKFRILQIGIVSILKTIFKIVKVLYSEGTIEQLKTGEIWKWQNRQLSSWKCEMDPFCIARKYTSAKLSLQTYIVRRSSSSIFNVISSLFFKNCDGNGSFQRSFEKY